MPVWKTSLLQQYFLHHLESKQFWCFAKSFEKHKDAALLQEQGVHSWDCVFCLNVKQLQYLRLSTGKPWSWQQWSQRRLSCRFVKVNFYTDLFVSFLNCFLFNYEQESWVYFSKTWNSNTWKWTVPLFNTKTFIKCKVFITWFAPNFIRI